MTKPLDSIDMKIIAIVQDDGRSTNKGIAAEVGVSEATIANRLRRLIDDGVLFPTVQRDIYALGYAFQAIVQIWVSNGSPRDVARHLTSKSGISTVCLMHGSPEIILFFNARDHAHAAAVVAEEVAGTAGVERTELNVTLAIYKMKASTGMIRNSTEEIRRAHMMELGRVTKMNG